MLRRMLRASLCLLLGAALACAPYRAALSPCLSAYLGAPAIRAGVHAGVPFSEMKFSMPDLAALADRAEDLRRRTEAGGDAKALEAELDALFSELSDAESMAALAYVHAAIDLNDRTWQTRSETLSAGTEPIYGTLVQIALLLSERRELRIVYDADTRAALRSAALLYDPAIAPLLKRERELTGVYNRLRTTLTVAADGEEWTYDRIAADQTLPFSAWYPILLQYRSVYAARAAELFSEQIGIRKEIAKTLGFLSYPAYRFAVYGRGYGPDRAAAFSELAERTLAPLYRAAAEETETDRELLYGFGEYPEAETVRAVGAVAAAILPALAEPWDYMQTYGLYSFDPSPAKQSGSFSTYFASYGAPFLFTSWDGTAAMPSTLLHEFGHFAGSYFRAAYGDASGGSLDLCEVDSEALELLALPYYDRLFGRRADEARAVKLTELLYTVLSGCAVNAFEQYAYTAEDVSEEALSRAFGTILKRFGLDAAGFTDTSWTEIPHLFSAPLYYFSYAAAGMTAFRLYERACASPNAAQRAYRFLLERPPQSRAEALLGACGIGDPLSEQAAEDMAKRIASAVLPASKRAG